MGHARPRPAHACGDASEKRGAGSVRAPSLQASPGPRDRARGPVRPGDRKR